MKCKFWFPIHTQARYHFEVFFTAKPTVLKMKVDVCYIILTGSSFFLKSKSSHFHSSDINKTANNTLETG